MIGYAAALVSRVPVMLLRAFSPLLEAFPLEDTPESLVATVPTRYVQIISLTAI